MIEGANPTAAETTELLVAISTHGDRAAFARLFSFYAPRVKSYLMRQGAGDGVAEELVQETFLSVWRKAGLFDPRKASAATWIFTIARNLRIDALRRSFRPELDPNDPALVPEPATPPDQEMESGQMYGLVRTAFQQLPEDQAAVIKLAFLEDKSHSQIAAELRLPLGTVKSRLRLALRRMRVIMDGED
jgi:RNA polymerase sigma-70 factor (ECF subfamily)